jgi:hypothetical protein
MRPLRSWLMILKGRQWMMGPHSRLDRTTVKTWRPERFNFVLEAINEDEGFVAVTKDENLSAWNEMFPKQED